MNNHLELHKEIELFLYHEAHLLDQSDFEGWLDLFTDDARYWMPTTETRDVDQKQSPLKQEWHLIEDDKPFLHKRYERLQTRLAHAEQPRSRTRRLVTNILIKENHNNQKLLVLSNFIIFRSRRDNEESFFVGRREDTLDRYGDKWKISNRSIFLDQRILPRAISIFF